MVEGMSVRAISRITGTDPNTILSILLTVGQSCSRLFNSQVRVHCTLRVTPAMEAKITDDVWSVEELLGFGEQARAA